MSLFFFTCAASFRMAFGSFPWFYSTSCHLLSNVTWAPFVYTLFLFHDQNFHLYSPIIFIFFHLKASSCQPLVSRLKECLAIPSAFHAYLNSSTIVPSFAIPSTFHAYSLSCARVYSFSLAFPLEIWILYLLEGNLQAATEDLKSSSEYCPSSFYMSCSWNFFLSIIFIDKALILFLYRLLVFLINHGLALLSISIGLLLFFWIYLTILLRNILHDVYFSKYKISTTGVARNFTFIPNARVPLLKFESNCHNISCDVSVDNHVGWMKSKILLLISEVDERFRDMVLLVSVHYQWYLLYLAIKGLLLFVCIFCHSY